MKTITVDGRNYRLSEQHMGEVIWDLSMPQVISVIRARGTQANLDDPRFGCHACGPFYGNDTILITRDN